MAAPNTIDSNVSELRIAKELTPGVLPGSPIWYLKDANTYSDFGGEVVTITRNPINASRQRKKGGKVDESAAGGFNTDVTQTNINDVLDGFLFAAYRLKAEFGGASQITNVDGTTEDYDAASGLTVFEIGDLVFASGFTNAENNGLKRVTGVTATALTVAEDLVDETPPAAAKLVAVGFQFGAGNLDVTAAAGGNYPTYDVTTKDATELGLIPGEWIWVGGDITDGDFTNVANNGFKRVRSVTATTITIDKSDSALVAEASTTETIQIFFGRVLKNETGTLIVKNTYQLERTLGAPDAAQPTEIQAQYEIGCAANELVLNTRTADKLNADMSFIGLREERIDGPTALKTGTRPAMVESDMFNTSSDMKRIALTVMTAGDEDPAPLFAYVLDFTLTINNNASVSKAVGVVGGFDIAVGDFEVGGDITAYFVTTDAADSINDVDNVSFDFHLFRNNAGMSFDVPVLVLGDGRPNVEKDTSITIPLSMEAADGSIVDASLDHTLLVSYYDYLPDAADT